MKNNMDPKASPSANALISLSLNYRAYFLHSSYRDFRKASKRLKSPNIFRIIITSIKPWVGFGHKQVKWTVSRGQGQFRSNISKRMLKQFKNKNVFRKNASIWNKKRNFFQVNNKNTNTTLNDFARISSLVTLNIVLYDLLKEALFL